MMMTTVLKVLLGGIVAVVILLIGIGIGVKMSDDKAKDQVVAQTAGTTVAASSGSGTQPVATDAQPSPVVANSPMPAVVVSVADLIKAYDGNPIAADQQYKDKQLQVTGRVDIIQSGLSDEAIVHLGGNGAMGWVITTGDASFDAYAATLSKGQTIKLLCTSAGETAGFPTLIECQPQ